MKPLSSIRNPHIRTRTRLAALGLVALLTILISGAGVAEERPNFILLLLDDAGWTDTGNFGGRMQTPHLDRLAAEGMRFTDCHSPAPNCSPSRAGILTGRIPTRSGLYSYLPESHASPGRGNHGGGTGARRGLSHRTFRKMASLRS